MSNIEIKRCKQLDTARDICSRAYDDVGHKSISAITRKLIKLRDYLNKEFPVKAKGKAGKPACVLRNCDVGTTEEQEKRFDAFCDSHKWVDDEGRNACLPDCPLLKTADCAINWAQMPYEKGENNGSK